MRPCSVRPLAIALIRRGDEVLLEEGFDTLKQDWFYRPLGGGIEFGEYGHQTVARELQEEIAAELRDIRYLFTLENIFINQGAKGHELVRLYEASFVDETLYERDEITGTDDGGVVVTAKWKPLSFFQAGQARLVPEGLLEALTIA